MPAWYGPPLVACLVLTAIHCHLGLHVLARGVIFVDIALAQAAALGMTLAILAGHEPRSGTAYAVALGSALVVSALLAATRERRGRIPHEAVIGVIYAVAAAGVIVLLDLARDPHGGEHVKEMLVGNLVFLGPRPWATVAKIAAIYATVGAIHAAARRPLAEISRDPEGARAAGRRVWLWDALFYATFAVVITSSVQVAGVLLVFSYLIVPAAIGSLVAAGWGARLLVGWGVGSAVSAGGIWISYDRPVGPVIVCLFGAALGVVAAVRHVVLSERRLLAAGRIAGGLAAGAGAVAGILALGSIEWREHWSHEPGAPAPPLAADAAPAPARDALVARLLAGGGDSLDAAEELEALPGGAGVDELRRGLHAASPDVRAACAAALGRLRASASAGDLAAVAADHDEPEDVRLSAARALVSLQDARGVGALVHLVADDGVAPVFADEAREALRAAVAGEVPADPAGLRAWWERARGNLVWDPAAGRFAAR